MYRQSFTRMLILATLATLAGLALVLSGCSTKSTKDDGGGGITAGDTIIVSVSPGSISTSVTAVVEAQFLTDGQPVENVEITFTTAPEAAASLSPETDTTDADGVAATLLTPLQTGDITITATSGDQQVIGSTTLSVSAGAEPTGSGFVWLTVSPSSLLTGAQDTATVRVEVRDSIAQQAPQGTKVVVVAGEPFVDENEDGYYTPGEDALTDLNGNGWWDSFGAVDSVGLTDTLGVVNLQYIGTAVSPRVVHFRATVIDDDISGWDTDSVVFADATALHSIYLSSDSLQLSVTQTGGVETAILRATGYDIWGSPVAEGTPINFQILDGPGGGEHLYNEATAYGPYSTYTDEYGQAAVPLTAGTVSGSVRIRAYSGAVISNATQVVVAAGPPANVWIASDTCNVPFWTMVNEENRVVAVVSDIYNNPVNDSTVVYWSCDEGVIKATEGRTVSHEGVVSTKWVSTGSPIDGDGIVQFWAETAGGTVADTAFFYNTWLPDTLMVTGVPATMVLDGKTEVKVWVTAIDFHDLPVVAGTSFEGEANYLKVTGGAFNDGCNVAWDRVTITSTTLDFDYSAPGGNDDGIGAIDYVSYYTGISAISTYQVILTTGYAYRGNSNINGPSTVFTGDQIDLSATIADRWGNPLADHTLTMTANGGTVSGATQETDQYGEASGFRWTAPGGEGSFTITVTDTDPRGGVVLTKTVSVTIP